MSIVREHGPSPGETPMPPVCDTHDLEISGKQLRPHFAGTTDIDQVEGTVENLLSEGMMTGGRKKAGEVGICCGGSDPTVSRKALTASLHGRQLTINTLGAANAIQVIAFKDGVCQGKPEKIKKRTLSTPDARIKDSVGVTIGDEDVTVVIAMGKLATGAVESMDTGCDWASQSQMAMGEDLGESLMHVMRADHDADVDREMGELLSHSNFIRLDFKKKEGVTVPSVPEVEAKSLLESHEASMGVSVHEGVAEVIKDDTPPKLMERICGKGSVICGSMGGTKYRGVDLVFGSVDEKVDKRHLLLRTEQKQGVNHLVVEDLTTMETEVHLKSPDDQLTRVNMKKGIAHIPLPPGEEVTVCLGAGDAPHMMLSDEGESAQSESALPVSQAAELLDVEELFPGIETKKYRVELKFKPKEAEQ